MKSMATAVPRAWEQTAAAAERLCVAVVWRRLKGDTCVASDCGAAVSEAAWVAEISTRAPVVAAAARRGARREGGGGGTVAGAGVLRCHFVASWGGPSFK